ncbi:MAG: hypothetical protein JST04_01000 [Bdellovibrionales bacterium]|nr:hypothetical protein [Bdellovibrionales bacterium]
MLGIRFDNTIEDTCNEIAKLFKEKFGKEINPKIVHNVSQSQFYMIEPAFREKDQIKFDYIGKLVVVEKRVERAVKDFGKLKESYLPLPVVTFKAQGNGDNDNNGLSDRLRQIPNSEQDSGQKDYHSLRDEW